MPCTRSGASPTSSAAAALCQATPSTAHVPLGISDTRQKTPGRCAVRTAAVGLQDRIGDLAHQAVDPRLLQEPGHHVYLGPVHRPRRLDPGLDERVAYALTTGLLGAADRLCESVLADRLTQAEAVEVLLRFVPDPTQTNGGPDEGRAD